MLGRGLLPAALEIGAAVKSAEAWEIEARLIYDEFAWFLYEELWDLSATSRSDLAADERRQRIDELLDPLLDPSVSDADRATLLGRRLPIGVRGACVAAAPRHDGCPTTQMPARGHPSA